MKYVEGVVGTKNFRENGAYSLRIFGVVGNLLVSKIAQIKRIYKYSVVTLR